MAIIYQHFITEAKPTRAIEYILISLTKKLLINDKNRIGQIGHLQRKYIYTAAKQNTDTRSIETIKHVIDRSIERANE